MIRIAKVKSITYPNPKFSDDARKESMDLVFSPGQPMATLDWADIYEGMPAYPYFIQIDADRHSGYLVKHMVTNDPYIIIDLTIWTDEMGLIFMKGNAYKNGEFFKNLNGPVAYVIGTGGTLFIPAKKVADNDVI